MQTAASTTEQIFSSHHALYVHHAHLIQEAGKFFDFRTVQRDAEKNFPSYYQFWWQIELNQKAIISFI